MSNHGVPAAAPLLSPAHQRADVLATLLTTCCGAGEPIYDPLVALALDAHGTSEITCALDQLQASHDLFTVTPVDLSLVSRDLDGA
jgi:hypothetical protein